MAAAWTQWSRHPHPVSRFFVLHFKLFLSSVGASSSFLFGWRNSSPFFPVSCSSTQNLKRRLALCLFQPCILLPAFAFQRKVSLSLSFFLSHPVTTYQYFHRCIFWSYCVPEHAAGPRLCFIGKGELRETQSAREECAEQGLALQIEAEQNLSEEVVSVAFQSSC